MISKRAAFQFAHGFGWQTSSEEKLRAYLRHAADMQSHLNQPAVNRFVDDHFEEFFDKHLIWLETNGRN